MQLNNFCGIDVGCTSIKMMAVVNGIPVYDTIPSGDDFTREELISSITKFYNSFPTNFDGIGIAFSGCTLDFASVEHTTLPCLQGFSVSDLSGLGCNNIYLLNDSNSAAIAGTIEYPENNVLVSITNGTGIGCGISINGELFTGGNGFLGEIYGNLTIDEGGNILKIGKICSGSKILKKLNASSQNSKEIIHQAATYLGMLLVNTINFYNPDVIYFSGGGFSFDNFLSEAIEFAKQNSYPHLVKNIIFAESKYQKYAGCIGAMKFVSKKIECQ